jgi:hypothetical protein
MEKELEEIRKELIQTKEQLNIEKKKIAKYLQYANVGIAVFNNDFNCLTSNHKFIQISNLVLKNVISKPVNFLTVIKKILLLML